MRLENFIPHFIYGNGVAVTAPSMGVGMMTTRVARGLLVDWVVGVAVAVGSTTTTVSVGVGVAVFSAVAVGVTVAVAVSVGVALGGSGVAVKVAVAGTAVNVAVATIGNGVAVAVAACVVHVAVGWMTAVWVAATTGCAGGCVGWTTAVATGGSVSVGSTTVVAVSMIVIGCVGAMIAVVLVPAVFVHVGIAVATSGGAVSVAINVLLSGSLLLTCVAVPANVGV